MANLLAGDALADPLVDRRQLFRLLAHPGDDAGRTDPTARRTCRSSPARSDPRGSTAGRSVDRRRLEALAILRRRDHAFGKRRLRHALGNARSGRPKPDVPSPAAGAREDRTPGASRPRSAPSDRAANGNARHTHASCGTTKSGLATCRSVSPAWPSWPPLVLPDLPRRLRGARGFFFNPSLEGGFELFVLSSPNRRRSSATKASSSAIRRSFEAINSWISGGMTIPL